MDIKELFKNRYTSRDYDEDLSVSDDLLNYILDCANLAPSAMGLQQTRLLVIKNKEMKGKVAKYFWESNSNKVSKSSFIVLLIGLTKNYFSNKEWLQERIDELNIIRSPEVIVDSYDEKKHRAENFDIIAASFMADYMVLAAAEKNIGSTIMTGLDFDGLESYLSKNELLDLNSERLVMTIAFGIPKADSEVEANTKNNKKRISKNTLVKII